MNLLTTLLSHQITAVEKLSKIKVSALYMEPGTGKTRTILELVIPRMKKGKITKVLWLCPCSVKKSLEIDLRKHIDDISFIEIYGIESISASSRIYMELVEFVEAHDVYLVVDESNLVKNWTALRTHRIIELSQKCTYKSILNGTPVSRNEADLFAQWFILDWRILGYKSYYTFARNHLEYDDYGNIKSVLNTEHLTKKIAPYTYQVKKSECMDLPEKEYYQSVFFIDEDHREHMSEVGRALLHHVDEYKSETIYRFLTGLQLVVSGYKLELKPSKVVNEDGEMVPHVSFSNKKRYYTDIYENPRICRLLKLLDDYEYDEKFIIYAKYTDEINEILHVLTKKYGDGAAVKFNGDVSLKKRNENIGKFMNEARFMVANKQCAGYGLNLQHASKIIFYSNDWDWATREQAEDRVHRIGQTETVEIIDIVALGTIDQRIKRNLDKKTDIVDSLKGEINKWKDDLLLERNVKEQVDNK